MRKAHALKCLRGRFMWKTVKRWATNGRFEINTIDISAAYEGTATPCGIAETQLHSDDSRRTFIQFGKVDVSSTPKV